MPRGYLIVLSLVALPLLGEAAFAQEIRPGQYRITTSGSFSQAGVETAIPETTMEMCFTPEQAQQATQPATSPEQPDCTIESLGQADGSIAIRMTCPDMMVETRTDWTADSYRTSARTVMTQDGARMTSDMIVSGQRLGDCQQ